MKRLLIVLLLVPWLSFAATYTEFYCNASTGSNINGGSDAGGTAKYTSTNGNWNGTSTFTPSDTQLASLIAVGDFASVYNDGATLAVYIARVVTINQSGGNITSIVLSTTARAGTAPTSSATGRSIKVGGTWKGPNAGSGFPITFSGTSLSQAINSNSDQVRVNFKNNATYSITSLISGSTQASELLLQGYSSSVGDGGKATIDGGGNNISLLSLGQNTDLFDFIVSNVGVSTGTGTGISGAVSNNSLFRVVVHDVRGSGIVLSSLTGTQLIECEVYAYNQSNTASSPGISLGPSSTAKRCYVHDGTGSNCDGIQLNVGNQNSTVDQCIMDTNGGNGILVSGGSSASGHVIISNSEFYNNTGAGIKFGSASAFYVMHIENNNFIKNGTYGIDGGASFTRLFGYMFNNGYGIGTQANSSGDYHTTGSLILDDNTGTNSRVVYASNITPYNAPTTGDFSIVLPAAQGVGRGAFTETDGTNTGTVGFPDLGAAQAQIGQAFPTPTPTPTATPTATATATPTATPVTISHGHAS